MRGTANLFWILAAFCVLLSGVYTVWSLLDVNIDIHSGRIEWVGSLGLLLVAIMSTLIAFYVTRLHRSQKGGELPEDRVDANIDDGDAEQGFFSPWSWWPVMMGLGAATVFTGLALGFWLSFIGVAFVLISIVGWVYEYYRGNFGR
jgi:hypothetical protein